MNRLTFEELQQIIDRAEAGKYQQPADCFSTTQYARHKGVSDSTARRRLRQLVDQGEVEGGASWPGLDIHGRPMTVYGWRLIKGG